jgi:hypothetical protein
MSPVVLLVIAVIAIAYLAVFIYTAWHGGKSRLELATGTLDALLVLAIVHRMTPWAGLPTLLWFVPVGLTVAAVVGVAYRWSQLPTTRPGNTRRRWIVAGLHAAIVLALLGILLWPA